MARVFPIDDDQSNFEFMRQAMSIDGHELAWAADGEEGLARVRQFGAELVVCDVVMPHLRGYAALETVRADPHFAGVPILLFSTAMNEDARAIGLHRGANEVLAKAFGLEPLRGAIRRCQGQDRP